MEKTKEILRLHDELGLSQREIAAATRCSLGTVSGILSKAKATGITYPVEMTAKQLGSALFPPKDGTGEEKHFEPDLEYIHHEMHRKGVTLTLLWEEYKTAHQDGLMYTQFCQRYRDFLKQNDVYMRKQYKAGERLETGWAGLTLPYGEGQEAYFFVAALPASACLYVEPFRDMGNHFWIAAHVNALRTSAEFRGFWYRITAKRRYRKRIIMTPTSTAHMGKWPITTASRSSRHGLANRGTSLTRKTACRSRSAASSQSCGIASSLPSRSCARRHWRSWTGWTGSRFRSCRASRLSVFLETEKDALRPLPASRFEYAEWKTVKAEMDYHVEFDGR